MPHSEPAPSLEQLQAVAKAHGVGVDFWGFYGNLLPVSAETLVRVLSALGVDVSTGPACERALGDRVDHEWRQMVPPTIIMREGSPTSFPVHVHDGAQVRVWVIDEEGNEWPAYPGQQWTPPREVDGVLLGHRRHRRPRRPHRDRGRGRCRLVARQPPARCGTRSAY